jgi:hypothetical protein
MLVGPARMSARSGSALAPESSLASWGSEAWIIGGGDSGEQVVKRLQLLVVERSQQLGRAVAGGPTRSHERVLASRSEVQLVAPTIIGIASSLEKPPLFEFVDGRDDSAWLEREALAELVLGGAFAQGDEVQEREVLWAQPERPQALAQSLDLRASQLTQEVRGADGERRASA